MATSVAWGAWETGGMAASEAAQAGFARRGLLPLSADRAHAALAELLASTRASGTVLDADWRRMGQDPVASRLPLLSGLLEAPPRVSPAGASLAVRLRGRRRRIAKLCWGRSCRRSCKRCCSCHRRRSRTWVFRSRHGFADGGGIPEPSERGVRGEYVAPMTVVFDYPDALGLARHVAGELGLLAAAAEPERREPVRDGGGPIAVVGLACRFPGGPDLARFWDLLAAGRCAVTEGRVAEAGGGPRYWGGYVDGIDRFDAEFFRIAPVEARLLDPQPAAAAGDQLAGTGGRGNCPRDAGGEPCGCLCRESPRRTTGT